MALQILAGDCFRIVSMQGCCQQHFQYHRNDLVVTCQLLQFLLKASLGVQHRLGLDHIPIGHPLAQGCLRPDDRNPYSRFFIPARQCPRRWVCCRVHETHEIGDGVRQVVGPKVRFEVAE